MDFPIAARQLWPLLEPLHAVVYFTPEVTSAAAAVGVERSARYFALRAAPMGAVSAEAASAIFYGFAPVRVAEALPAAWDKADPGDVARARSDGIDAAMGRLLDGVEPSSLAQAADLAAAAAECIDDSGGRPLTAANLSLLDSSGSAAVRLWQAATVLREHRGEGHVIALAHAQIGPVEAHVLRAAVGAADLDFLRISRGWSEAEVAAARNALRVRGWLDQRGALTDLGRTRQAAYEAATDRLAGSPWRGLGADRTRELAGLLRPLAARVVSGCQEAMDVGLGSPWPPPAPSA